MLDIETLHGVVFGVSERTATKGVIMTLVYIDTNNQTRRKVGTYLELMAFSQTEKCRKIVNWE